MLSFLETWWHFIFYSQCFHAVWRCSHVPDAAVVRYDTDLGGELPIPRHLGDHAEDKGDELVSHSCHCNFALLVTFNIFRFNWQSYNWEKYSLQKEVLPPGKLLLYPIQVDKDKYCVIAFAGLIYYSCVFIPLQSFSGQPLRRGVQPWRIPELPRLSQFSQGDGWQERGGPPWQSDDMIKLYAILLA